MQFDKVLVEQNHCHGLHNVNASCDQFTMHLSALFEQFDFESMELYMLHTETQAALLFRPYKC
jgi:hypothetical protein